MLTTAAGTRFENSVTAYRLGHKALANMTLTCLKRASHTACAQTHGSQASRRCTAPHASGAPVLGLVPHTFHAPSAWPCLSTSASSTLHTAACMLAQCWSSRMWCSVQLAPSCLGACAPHLPLALCLALLEHLRQLYPAQPEKAVREQRISSVCRALCCQADKDCMGRVSSIGHCSCHVQQVLQGCSRQAASGLVTCAGALLKDNTASSAHLAVPSTLSACSGSGMGGSLVVSPEPSLDSTQLPHSFRRL